MKVGILSAAHMHATGYAAALNQTESGELGLIWDDLPERGQAFAKQFGTQYSANREEVISSSDALVITSENIGHIELLELCAAAGKPVLCEKPIIGSTAHIGRLNALIESGAKIMTAFPCRYSPAFNRLLERVRAGEIGSIVSVCATNRGRCPFGWFTDVSKSGGGAMIDHVVHVADLLSVLLKAQPSKVTAQTGSNLYSQSWEDTAQLTLDYADGKFVTLDSSWSMPQGYQTWGDVTLNVVGEKGVIELDMFAQGLQFSQLSEPESGQIQTRFSLVGYGSDLDSPLVNDFIRFAKGEIDNPIPAQAGLDAVNVAFAGYADVAARAS